MTSTRNAKRKGSLSQVAENPQKQLKWKVLGVALLLENICPISLPEADNNAKPQILRTRPHPPPGSRETEVAAEIQGRKRRGKGAVIILNARPRGRSGSPLRHLRFNGERRAGVSWPERKGCPVEMARRGGRRERSVHLVAASKFP